MSIDGFAVHQASRPKLGWMTDTTYQSSMRRWREEGRWTRELELEEQHGDEFSGGKKSFLFCLHGACSGYWEIQMCVHAKSCATLCEPTDCNPPGSSTHGLSQARVLEWVALFSSRGSSQSRDRIYISCISSIGRWILYHCSTWEAQEMLVRTKNTKKNLLFSSKEPTL